MSDPKRVSGYEILSKTRPGTMPDPKPAGLTRPIPQPKPNLLGPSFSGFEPNEAVPFYGFKSNKAYDEGGRRNTRF